MYYYRKIYLSICIISFCIVAISPTGVATSEQLADRIGQASLRSAPTTTWWRPRHALEFTCWNGEIVRVAFALDCHDREVIGWTATTARHRAR
jgi:transposase InsO family protein